MQDRTEENSECPTEANMRQQKSSEGTADETGPMRQRERKRRLYWQPIFTKVGFVSVILVSAFVGWTLFFQQSVLENENEFAQQDSALTADGLPLITRVLLVANSSYPQNRAVK